MASLFPVEHIDHDRGCRCDEIDLVAGLQIAEVFRNRHVANARRQRMHIANETEWQRVRRLQLPLTGYRRSLVGHDAAEDLLTLLRIEHDWHRHCRHAIDDIVASGEFRRRRLHCRANRP